MGCPGGCPGTATVSTCVLELLEQGTPARAAFVGARAAVTPAKTWVSQPLGTVPLPVSLPFVIHRLHRFWVHVVDNQCDL